MAYRIADGHGNCIIQLKCHYGGLDRDYSTCRSSNYACHFTGMLYDVLWHGAAVAVRVSNFNGQNDRVNVRRTAYSGFHIMLGIALIGALPIFLLRHQLGGWFSDSQAVSVTVAQLIIPFIVYQFGDGLQINFANALRGIADVKPMMYIAFIAYFLISLPAGYFFGFVMDWGIVGIWMAFPFGLTTAGIMYYLRFRSRTLEKH